MNTTYKSFLFSLFASLILIFNFSAAQARDGHHGGHHGGYGHHGHYRGDVGRGYYHHGSYYRYYYNGAYYNNCRVVAGYWMRGVWFPARTNCW